MTDALERDAPEPVAEAFVAGAAALRHIGGDPLLPAQLLPPEWPGCALRSEYTRYQRAFDATARAWFRRPA
jgi:phenylacetic acid degradation operon negative regulatory protein